MSASFRRRYGASPLHLLAHVAAFAICVYALSLLLNPKYTQALNFAEYFIGGALLHDLVFLPLYTALDRIARTAERNRVLPYANYLRIPAAISGVILLVYFPLILGDGRANYIHDSGHAPPDFLGRWLLITAALFCASAITYAVALRRAK